MQPGSERTSRLQFQ